MGVSTPLISIVNSGVAPGQETLIVTLYFIREIVVPNVVRGLLLLFWLIIVFM